MIPGFQEAPCAHRAPGHTPRPLASNLLPGAPGACDGAGPGGPHHTGDHAGAVRRP